MKRIILLCLIITLNMIHCKTENANWTFLTQQGNFIKCEDLGLINDSITTIFLSNTDTSNKQSLKMGYYNVSQKFTPEFLEYFRKTGDPVIMMYHPKYNPYKKSGAN